MHCPVIYFTLPSLCGAHASRDFGLAIMRNLGQRNSRDSLVGHLLKWFQRTLCNHFRGSGPLYFSDSLKCNPFNFPLSFLLVRVYKNSISTLVSREYVPTPHKSTTFQMHNIVFFKPKFKRIIGSKWIVLLSIDRVQMLDKYSTKH